MLLNSSRVGQEERIRIFFINTIVEVIVKWRFNILKYPNDTSTHLELLGLDGTYYGLRKTIWFLITQKL